jgi:hypothetical protein
MALSIEVNTGRRDQNRVVLTGLPGRRFSLWSLFRLSERWEFVESSAKRSNTAGTRNFVVVLVLALIQMSNQHTQF